MKNDRTGEVVFTPPQSHGDIVECMRNLEIFINDDEAADIDPLVKMAIIHHQFETIHPFYDGNGRTVRIINILYLVQKGLLDSPVLYLSRYVNQNKAECYRLLQAVRSEGVWIEWNIWALTGIEQTAIQTTRLVHSIRGAMQDYRVRIRTELPRIYSQDLLNNIFSHPYNKIGFVERDLDVSRVTATKYLEELTRIGAMEKVKIGRESYYMNMALLKLLGNVQAL